MISKRWKALGGHLKKVIVENQKFSSFSGKIDILPKIWLLHAKTAKKQVILSETDQRKRLQKSKEL